MLHGNIRFETIIDRRPLDLRTTWGIKKDSGGVGEKRHHSKNHDVLHWRHCRSSESTHSLRVVAFFHDHQERGINQNHTFVRTPKQIRDWSLRLRTTITMPSIHVHMQEEVNALYSNIRTISRANLSRTSSSFDFPRRNITSNFMMPMPRSVLFSWKGSSRKYSLFHIAHSLMTDDYPVNL